MDGDGSEALINSDGSLNTRTNLLSSLGVSNVMVGLTATLVVAADASRRRLQLANKGGSNIWLGSNTSVSAGATGINFDALTAGSNTSIDNYTGSIYAILGPGVSSNYLPLGIATYS